MIRLRKFSTSVVANASSKKKHWAEDANKCTNIDRAFEHFDDLYASVYAKKWPSMRLGLLCPQKYVAIPNTFSDVESISSNLESLGAYDLKSLWERGREKLSVEEPKRTNEEAEKERLQDLDRTLQSIANTKVAEELDILYENAPMRKLPGRLYGDSERRVIGDIREASAEFLPPSKLKGIEDFQLESEYYSFYQDNQSKAIPDSKDSAPSSIYSFMTASNFTPINFPPFLRPFTFVAGSSANFPPSGFGKQAGGLRDWLCLNGASIAPVVALDLKPDVNMLDLCAGPGTKSLLSLMTMCPGTLTCNDVESNRLGRVKKIFEEFTGSGKPSNVIYTRYNATDYPSASDYQRVLADVPCSSDRVSATISDNSIFKPARTRERLNLVKTQKAILMSGLRSLAKTPGSVCVYSTCTLSPIENDGTVAAALRETNVTDLVIDIEGLWNFLLPLKAMDLLSISRTKFGVLIEPTVTSNFGPMYISRLVYAPFAHASPPPASVKQ